MKQSTLTKGRELERIYVEEGVIDKSESLSDNDYSFTKELDLGDFSEGVIGHMEDTDGSHVVDLVFDCTKTGKKCRNEMHLYQELNFIFYISILVAHSSQKKKFICEICSRSYTQQSRYVSHKMSHHNVQYECIQCMEKFSSRKLMYDFRDMSLFCVHSSFIKNIFSDLNIRKLLTIPVKE